MVKQKKETNIDEEVNRYIYQILLLTFVPVNESIWKTIQDEGLDIEFDSHNKSDWYFANLDLTDKDKIALKDLEPDTIEKFNVFDIKLKDEFDLMFIDLIDYEKGDVVIVTPFLNN